MPVYNDDQYKNSNEIKKFMVWKYINTKTKQFRFN